MVDLSHLAKPENRNFRGMLVGFPGAGKTGALACLADAGFKLRILDYDGNLEPLINYCTPEGLANIDVAILQDKLRQGPDGIEPVGVPTAAAEGGKMLDRWKYTHPGTKEEVDLGRSKDWGPDHIIVLDSLTSQGRAVMRKQMALGNRSRPQQGDWGAAMANQSAFLEKLGKSPGGHHVIVLSHLRMIGPKEIGAKEDDTNKQIKEVLAEMIPTKYYPSALGRELPQQIGGQLPILLEVTNSYKGTKPHRIIQARPRPELDLKIPASLEGLTLPIEDGMLKVFKALGCAMPGTPEMEAAIAATTVATEKENAK